MDLWELMFELGTINCTVTTVTLVMMVSIYDVYWVPRICMLHRIIINLLNSFNLFFFFKFCLCVQYIPESFMNIILANWLAVVASPRLSPLEFHIIVKDTICVPPVPKILDYMSHTCQWMRTGFEECEQNLTTIGTSVML
jgi:hypothetical protein